MDILWTGHSVAGFPAASAAAAKTWKPLWKLNRKRSDHPAGKMEGSKRGCLAWSGSMPPPFLVVQLKASLRGKSFDDGETLPRQWILVDAKRNYQGDLIPGVGRLRKTDNGLEKQPSVGGFAKFGKIDFIDDEGYNTIYSKRDFMSSFLLLSHETIMWWKATRRKRPKRRTLIHFCASQK